MHCGLSSFNGTRNTARVSASRDYQIRNGKRCATGRKVSLQQSVLIAFRRSSFPPDTNARRKRQSASVTANFAVRICRIQKENKHLSPDRRHIKSLIYSRSPANRGSYSCGKCVFGNERIRQHSRGRAFTPTADRETRSRRVNGSV